MSGVIPFALGVALSPIPIAAMALILGGQRARVNGPSFAAGWLVGVAVTAVLCLVVVRAAGVTEDQPTWLAVAELAFGVAFLLLAFRLATSARRPQGSMPHWLSTLDACSPGKVAGLGVTLSGANPKVIALALGGALALANAGLSGAAALPALAAFIAIGAAGILVPLVAYTAAPSRSEPALAWIRRSVVHYDRVILAVLAVALGGKFVLDGMRAL